MPLLGVLAGIIGLYFLWGVFDPASVNELESRWAGTARTTLKEFGQSTTRWRNLIGFLFCAVVVALAVVIGEERPNSEPLTSPRSPINDTDPRELRQLSSPLIERAQYEDEMIRSGVLPVPGSGPAKPAAPKPDAAEPPPNEPKAAP